jgi:hypothetical protein
MKRKVRIAKKTKGKYTFYRAEMHKTYFFGLIKRWTPFWASEYDGSINFWGSWGSLSRAERYIETYSDLTGEKIEMVEA